MEYLVTIEELMGWNFPEQNWLVDKLIPAGAITILSGPPASYKTWVTLHTALCVARGEPLFGKFDTSQGSVLIIDEENSQRLVQERLYHLGAAADLPVFFNNEPGFVLSEAEVDWALQNCEKHDIKLVIIDSLVRIHTSDENSSGDMNEVFKQLKKFTNQGIALLITHHNRKPGANSTYGSNEMRGSSDILASVDAQIGLRRKDERLTVYQGKNRYAKEFDPFEILAVSDDDSFAFEYQGQIRHADNKDRIIKNGIISVLAEHSQRFQKELLKDLEALGVKTNEHKLRELLGEMVADKTLAESSGQGKTKFYSLNPEANDG